MIKILTALKSKGVFVTLDATGENLSIRGNIRSLTEEDKNGIRGSKSEIISFLKEQKQSTQQIPTGTITGDTLELSPNQKSIWVYEKIEGPGSAYIIPGIYEFEMPGFNADRFYHAVNLLVQQTDSLRTLFIEENDQPRQKILASVDIQQHVEIIEFTGADADKEVQAEIDRRYALPFSLSEKPLWEIVLFRLPQSQFRFFLKVHHLVADGESLNLIIRRTLEIYSGTETIKPQHEGSLQYSDYVTWINDRKHFTASADFWKKDLQDYEDDFRIPYDYTDAGRSFNGKELHYLFPAERSAKLIEFTNEHKISIASVFTGAVAIVLSKWGRKSDLVVGTPAAGRNHPQLWNTIGNFVNTLPLRVSLNYETGTLEYLNGIQQKYHAILDHQLYPFSYILEDIGYQYREDEFPLFNVMISVPNNQTIDSFEEKIVVNRKASLYDITFTFIQAKGDFKIITEYNAAKFDEATIYDMSSQAELVLGSFFEDTARKIQHIKLVTPAQEAFILEHHCRSNWPVTANEQHIVELFRKNLKQYPDRIAVTHGSESLTYREFGERVATLGTWLLEKGLEKGQRAVTVLPKSIDQLTALWAIWCSGGVYVPADTEIPRERINAIIEDCTPQLVIDREFMKEFHQLEDYKAAPNFFNLQPPTPDVTAYIVFTSGSTGAPKGVMISHANLIIKLYEFNYALKNDEHTATITTTSLAFDVSMLEVAMPLTTGGKVVIADELYSTEFNTLLWYVLRNNVTILQGTPTYFALFMKDLSRTVGDWVPVNDQLKHICIGGESLNATLVKRFAELIPNVSINNHCGPTETCIDVIANYGVKNFEKNILGKPIGNTEAFVVDECGNLLPDNMIGEMVVGGPSVGQGYWNRADLTSERFATLPLSKGTIYYSGDLVRRTRKGEIEFIGRKDNQMKIRGYRVELEEISKSILKMPGIIDVYTGMYKNLLVSWVVPDKKYVSDERIDMSEKAITDFLGTRLPSYMVPNAIEFMPALPANANGKVDFRKLPAPQISRRETAPPENETEAVLLEIVKPVLDIPEIGINDNFFEMGGHSLHLVRIANQVNQRFATNIRIKDLFTNNTIKTLAALIVQANENNISQVVVPRTEFESNYAPLSPTQNRLWLTSQLGGSVSLNMPIVFNLIGDFDIDIFRKSVWDIIERQESVRTCLRNNPEGMLSQYIFPMEEFRQILDIPYYDHLAGQDEEVTVATSNISTTQFDLATGPLFRVGAFKLNDQLHAIYLVLHHTVGDGWSLEVLFSELIKNYNAYIFTGKGHEFPPLSIRYRDYATWYRDNVNKLFTDEESYWVKKYKKPLPVYKFPFEKPTRPARRTFSGGGLVMWASDIVTSMVNEHARRLKITPFAVTLGIFKTLLYRYTGYTDQSIGTPISGRFNVQTENLVGLFLNTLPIRSEFSETDTFEQVMMNEGQVLKDSLDNQFFQMDEIVRRMDIKTQTGHTPLFDIMFMFQNFNSVGITKDTDNSTELRLGSRNVRGGMAQFDIVMAWVEVSGRLELSIAFNPDVYEEQHVRELCVDTLWLMEKVLRDSSKPVKTFFEECDHVFLVDKPVQFTEVPETETTADETIPEAGVSNTEGNQEIKNGLKSIFLKYIEGDIQFHEDYFARGGNSLGAIQSVNDINEMFGTEISIIDFYTNPSINQLHDIVTAAAGGAETVTEKSIMLKLNEHASGRPEFFMLPPIVGSGIIFKPLANALGNTFNVYGLDTPVLDVETDRIIAELSQTMYNEITARIESSGPVYLVGYSAGVNLAYEITKLLEADGRNVVLFMIDRGPEIEGSGEFTEELIQQILDQHMPLVEQVAVKGDEELIKSRITMIIRGLAAKGYSVKDSVQAPVYAFECDGNGNTGYMKGWSSYTQSGFVYETLAGNHYEALSPQNVTKLSEIIKKVYDEKSGVH